MKSLRQFAVLLVGLSLAGTCHANAQSEATALSDQCAALAASKWEPSNPPSVAFSAIDPAAALPICKAALEENSTPEAQYRVARVLLAAGRDVEAFKIVEGLEDSGLSIARDALAYLLLTGKGTKADIPRGVEIARAMAESGFAPGLSRLGAAFLNGTGVPRDPAAAAELFVRAADKGEDFAIYILGWMLETGTATKADPVKAVAYYAHAAEMGYPPAKKSLAEMYASGAGVKKSSETAARLMQEAANLGEEQAQERLGYFYQTGFGVETDIIQAMQWYETSLERGNGGAAFNLGVLHELGQNIPAAPQKAVVYYERAIKLGNTAALGRLGVMAYQGRGLDKDLTRAGALLSKADLAGNTQAKMVLAEMLYQGSGLPKDQDRALEIVRPVSEKHPTAAHVAALILLQTGGDPEEIEIMFRRATAGNGIPQAKLEYANYLTGRHPATKDRNVTPADKRRAFPLYKAAADAGLPAAMLEVGWAYYYGGNGTSKNIDKAESWAKRAQTGGADGVENLLGLVKLARKLDAKIKKLEADQSANKAALCKASIKLCNRGCKKLDDGSWIYNTRDGKHWFHKNGKRVTGDAVPDYSCEVK